MDVVKILDVEKEVLKRFEMICRFACCEYFIKHGSIINIKGSEILEVKSMDFFAFNLFQKNNRKRDKIMIMRKKMSIFK